MCTDQIPVNQKNFEVGVENGKRKAYLPGMLWHQNFRFEFDHDVNRSRPLFCKHKYLDDLL